MTAALFVPLTAHADVASWLFVGAGPSLYEDQRTERQGQLALELDTGFGSPPSEPIIVGGLVRVQPHWGDGVDLALLVRTATQGYVLGDWGAALDLGGYQRWWGIGSTGFVGTLSLGGPWGITLNGTAALGTEESRTYVAVLGIDFARLTVYRTSGLSWLPNPFPAVREGN